MLRVISREMLSRAGRNLSRSFSSAVPGVSIKTVKPGDGGASPRRGQTVSVHYVGKLAGTERVFDSSRTRGPFSFQVGVGQVIAGWDEAIPQMTRGQVAIVTCPPGKAYGARGAPPVIPPNATLDFEVELLDFK